MLRQHQLEVGELVALTVAFADQIQSRSPTSGALSTATLEGSAD